MHSIKLYNELSKDELYEILQLRSLVFVVEQNCPYLDLDDQDQTAYHIQIRNQSNKLIGTARILPKTDNKKYMSIGRVVSHPDFRKDKIGHQLMELGLKYIESHFSPVQIKLSAQSHLVNFYSQYKFVSTGKEYLEDNIPHTEMIRTI